MINVTINMENADQETKQVVRDYLTAKTEEVRTHNNVFKDNVFTNAPSLAFEKGESHTASDGQVPNEEVAAPVPTPPVTDTADAPTPPAPSATADETELDAEGMPWDERIHAGSKAKKKTDGLWKPKRNVDPVLVRQVKAEYAGQQQEEAPVVPETPAAPEAPAVPETPAAPKAEGKSYEQLATLVGRIITGSPEKFQELLDIAKAAGYENIQALEKEEPEVIGEVYVKAEELLNK